MQHVEQVGRRLGIIAALTEVQLQPAGTGDRAKADQFHVILNRGDIHFQTGMGRVMAFQLARADGAVFAWSILRSGHQ